MQKSDIRKSEIYRYMGLRVRLENADNGNFSQSALSANPGLDAIVDEVTSKMLSGIRPKYMIREMEIRIAGNAVAFTDETSSETMLVESSGLAGNLSDCRKVLLFAATLGDYADRLVHRYELTSMIRASAAQAAGAEFIEAFCDLSMKELRQKYSMQGLFLKPRFSPGYGDFRLEHQKDFFRLLDPEKNLGIRLSESLLMVPTKSVTAVIGLTENPEACHISKCARCVKTDCEFRMVYENE